MGVDLTPLGVKVTATTPYHASYGANYQQTGLRVQATQGGLLTAFGVYAKRSGSNNSKLQMGIWEDVAGAPGQLLGFTPVITIGGTAKNYESGLAPYGKNDARTGNASNALALVPGKWYWLGLLTVSRQTDLYSLAGNTSPATYIRSITSDSLTDPFGTATSSPYYTEIDVYANVRLPNAPTVTPTSPTGTINSATPTLTATAVIDEIGAPYYNRLAAYQVEVRNKATTALIYQSGLHIASAAERSSAQPALVYNGPALSQDSWEWRIQVQDDAGTFSQWSGWTTFTIANLGNVDATTATPSSKQEAGTVTTWGGMRWTSPTLLAANAVQIRILQAGNPTPVRTTEGTTGPIALSPTVNNNNFISVADSLAKLTSNGQTALPSGTYQWQMQARDTNGGWSPWSSLVSFSVNWPPNLPTNLSPASGSTVAARPLLTWNVSDPDNDDILGGDLVSDYLIQRMVNGLPSGSPVTGTTGNVDPTTGKGYFQTTIAELPSDGTYQWQIRGRDQSAVAAGTGLGPYSAPQTFNLITAAAATITSPLQNQILQTSTPQISWTLSGGALQVFYQVDFYANPSDLTPFFSSGQISVAPSSAGTYTPPGGFLKNGKTYNVTVTVWTSGGTVKATTPKRQFTIQYVSANLVNNVQAIVTLLPRDVEATTVQVSWDQTTYAQGSFGGYIVWRRTSDEAPSEAVPLAQILSVGQTIFFDYNAPPNASLIYSVSQLQVVGGDIRSSDMTEAPIDTVLTIPVINSLLDGSIRAAVKWLSTGLSKGFNRDENPVPTWGSHGLPVLIRGPEGYGQQLLSLSFNLRSDSWGQLHEHMADWKALVESGHPVCVRTETDRIFARIVPGGGWLQRGDVGVYQVTLDLEEIFWSEGVVVDT